MTRGRKGAANLKPEPEVAAAARKKASTTPAPDKVTAGPGHNSTLSDDQQKALFFQHKAKYTAALEAKKKADSDLKLICKAAKADVGEHVVLQFKAAIDAGDPEKARNLKARMEAQYAAARWVGMPLGSQADLFSEDRRPATERAEGEGFEAGAAGVSMKVPERYGPSSPEGQAWCAGWNKGQESIFKVEELRGTPMLKGTGAPAAPPNELPEGEGGDNEGDDGDDGEG